VKVDAVGGTNKIVGFSMDEQDGSAGVGNGGEGVLAVGVEAGETSHATGDVVKVIYGIHPAVGAEHHGTGVALGVVERTERFEGDDDAEARIDRGPTDGDGSAVGDSDGADFAGDQAALLQGVEDLNHVAGFDGAVADAVSGGSSVAAMVDEDDAISLAGEGEGIELVGRFLLAVAESG